MSSLYYRDKDARRSPVEEFTVLCGRGLWDRPVKARVATARRSKPFLRLLYLVPSSLFLFFACFVLAILLSTGVCFFLLPFTIVFSWRLFLRLFPASLRPSLMSVFMSLFLFVVFFLLLYVFLHFPFPFLLCFLRSFFLSVSLSSFLFLFCFLSFSLSAFFLYVLLSSFFLSCFLSVFLSWFLSFFLFHAFFLSVFLSFLLSFVPSFFLSFCCFCLSGFLSVSRDTHVVFFDAYLVFFDVYLIFFDVYLVFLTPLPAGPHKLQTARIREKGPFIFGPPPYTTAEDLLMNHYLNLTDDKCLPPCAYQGKQHSTGEPCRKKRRENRSLNRTHELQASYSALVSSKLPYATMLGRPANSLNLPFAANHNALSLWPTQALQDVEKRLFDFWRKCPRIARVQEFEMGSGCFRPYTLQ